MHLKKPQVQETSPVSRQFKVAAISLSVGPVHTLAWGSNPNNSAQCVERHSAEPPPLIVWRELHSMIRLPVRGWLMINAANSRPRQQAILCCARQHAQRPEVAQAWQEQAQPANNIKYKHVECKSFANMVCPEEWSKESSATSPSMRCSLQRELRLLGNRKMAQSAVRLHAPTTQQHPGRAIYVTELGSWNHSDG